MKKDLKKYSQNLKKNTTQSENYLWYFLRNRRLKKYKFRRQYVIPPYIVDFVCLKKKIIIELDGGQHNHNKHQTYDEKRTEFLKSAGYQVIRFWNEEIFKNPDEVLGVIFDNLENKKPQG